jgi:hypothetical protein
VVLLPTITHGGFASSLSLWLAPLAICRPAVWIPLVFGCPEDVSLEQATLLLRCPEPLNVDPKHLSPTLATRHNGTVFDHRESFDSVVCCRCKMYGIQACISISGEWTLETLCWPMVVKVSLIPESTVDLTPLGATSWKCRSYDPTQKATCVAKTNVPRLRLVWQRMSDFPYASSIPDLGAAMSG